MEPDSAAPGSATLATAAGKAPAAASRTESRAVHAAKASQDEFGFGEVESRGHFEKTDRNLFDGQDLDVPTYLRKGIKIAI
jgi:cell division protein FtsZ